MLLLESDHEKLDGFIANSMSDSFTGIVKPSDLGRLGTVGLAGFCASRSGPFRQLSTLMLRNGQ
jgi:hypothetical protein